MTYARDPSPDPAPLPGGQQVRPQTLPALTLTELVRAIRDGSLSPAGLVTEALSSLHRWQPAAARSVSGRSSRKINGERGPAWRQS